MNVEQVLNSFRAKTAREAFLTEYSLQMEKINPATAGIAAHVRLSTMVDSEVIRLLQSDYGYEWQGSRWAKPVQVESHDEWLRRVAGLK